MAKNANEYGDAVGRGIVSSHKCPTCDVRYENNDRDSRAHVTRCAKVDMTGIDLDQIICIRSNQQGRKSGLDYYNMWYCRTCGWTGVTGIGPKQMKLIQTHATACSAGLGVKQRGRDVVRQGVHQHIINRDLHDVQNP